MPISSVKLALDRFTTFGDLLRYLRRRVGYTQRELSIAVNYSDTQISRLEQNERLPDLATLTARFLPALHLEDQPEVAARLLELAAAVRREDAPATGLPPYQGLQHFDEADADLFFGREALADLLVQRLTERYTSDHRFLAVVGASGSGKSSAVRAGLIPALRWRRLSSGWMVTLMTPTAHPLDSLAASLSGEIRQSLPSRRLVDDLVQSPQTLQSILRSAVRAAGATHALLVVDQFEELFTLCRSDAEQFAFVDSLISAAFQPEGIAIVVIVLRADFYAHCARYDLLRQALSQHQEYIGPMTHEELRRAIEEPAKRGHWEIEPGLVELLLHDVGADAGRAPEPGALPLLSHALLATWQRRRGRVMTLSGYTASGGVRGAIAETAEAVFYDQLEPEQRNIARQIFLRLTELGGDEATADTRRRVKFDELASSPEDRTLVHEVLQTLADARLITTDQDTAEVAHEALIREWPTLRGWLEEDREGLRLHRRLTEAAQEWNVLGRDPGGLYRGVKLAHMLEWAGNHAQEINALEKLFLNTSRELEEKEAAEIEAQRQRELAAAQSLAAIERNRAEDQAFANRRLRHRAVGLVTLLAIAGLLAVLAVILWQRAIEVSHLATSRELAAAAVNNLQVDPERSVLLALSALNEVDTLEARNALHQAVPELHQLHKFDAHPGGVPDVVCSPDGTRLASIGADGQVLVWDAKSGEKILPLNNDHGELGGNLAFSPDGNTLAAAWETRVILWNVGDGALQAELAGTTVGTSVGYNLGVGQICFSPDGKRLAVANLDGLPRVFAVDDMAEVLSLPVSQPAKAMACSPDAIRLATAGDDGIVRVWDAMTGRELHAFGLGGIIHSVAFSGDATWLAAASEDGRVKVWDVTSGSETLSLPRQAGIYDIAFLGNRTIATAGQDGVTRVWVVGTGMQLLSLAGSTSTVISVAGSQDGTRIYTGAYDGSLRIWDATPGRELWTVSGHDAIVWDVAYSPDGSRLLTASVDGTAKLWDSETGRLLFTFKRGNAPTDGFTGLVFSPDGTRFATGSLDGRITLWNTSNGEILATLNGHANMVTGLAFSPDGNRLASASWDGSARVWDIVSGEASVIFNGHSAGAQVIGVAFSPDGKMVFTCGDDKKVRQWDAVNGQEVRIFSENGKDIYGVAVNPQGDLLAAANQDGEIILWDLETGKVVHRMTGHAGLTLRLAFNADGSQIASASFDKLAKVWDVATGEEVISLYGNLSNVFGVAFSPDGRRLATAGADGSLRTFTLQSEELINLAQTRVTRSLTVEECRKFLHVTDCP